MLASSKSQPYNISYDDGYYFFQTDQNIRYSCRFQQLTSRLPPLLGIYDIEISDFEFFPINPPPDAKYDPRVSATVVDLMEEFFENDRQVLIYICDATDGRPQARQALFSRWHRSIAPTIEHQSIRIAVGHQSVYGGMFLRQNFPERQVLQDELIDKASELILEKFGR